MKLRERLRDMRRKGNSIRWKIAVYMSFFVAIVLLVTWFFQVFLLDSFFRMIKKDEMQETARHLLDRVHTSELAAEAYGEAIEHSLCIMLFQMGEQNATQMINVDATGSNLIMSLSPERLRYFYQKAMTHDGSYFSRITFGGFEVDDGGIMDELPFQKGAGEAQKIPSKNIRMVYVELLRTDNGEEYMILLDTSIQPLDSTVRTLVTQQAWIAAIIIVVAGIMVFLLYRRITSPLVRMNESAKMLAKGNYDTVFAGEGYLETRELADTLNYAAHELSRLDALQKELIANISHDLRTPLTMIKGYGEVMRDLPGENTPENVQVIIDETTRLSELVNDLLDLSKIESGAVTPCPVRFNLTGAVREVMTRYETLTKHRGYRVEFLADCDVEIVADRGMLLQVIYNLINNAVNYTGKDLRVTVTQTLNAGNVRISVTDTGEGISPEQMPLIWDRYYKVDRVHRRAMIGTGLGLSIVKGILELHRAAYGVSSQEGCGATFWFELPISQMPNETDKEENDL